MNFLVLRYLRGEGCGAMVLKPAHKAVPGSIYANVLGSSVMSDGASASITAPNGNAQEQLINRTWKHLAYIHVM